MESLVIYLAAGLATGVVSGLFGVGGGLTVVPALVLALPFAGVPAHHVTTMRKVNPMQKARASLVLRDPFLASLALRLKLEEDPSCPTAATDGLRLIFSDYVEEGPSAS